MVLTYVNGVMMTFVQGFPVISDAADLDHRIQAILRGFTTLGDGSP